MKGAVIERIKRINSWVASNRITVLEIQTWVAEILNSPIQEEARNPTIKRSDEGAGQKMELAGTRPKHARAPPGATSPVKLRQNPLTRRFSQTYET